MPSPGPWVQPEGSLAAEEEGRRLTAPSSLLEGRGGAGGLGWGSLAGGAHREPTPPRLSAGGGGSGSPSGPGPSWKTSSLHG